jgi:hypothetical protein
MSVCLHEASESNPRAVRVMVCDEIGSGVRMEGGKEKEKEDEEEKKRRSRRDRGWDRDKIDSGWNSIKSLDALGCDRMHRMRLDALARVAIGEMLEKKRESRDFARCNLFTLKESRGCTAAGDGRAADCAVCFVSVSHPLPAA